MTSSPAFTTLPLSAAMQANLAELGYKAMTPIQAESLPSILAGQDVIAQAKTGSGKTAAFGIGLLQAINPRQFAVQALVLCPTRELADQVAKELRRLARCIDNTKILTLCGGIPMGPQLGSLEHGAHIAVGTPGRVLKHLQKKSLSLTQLKSLVLDEADRMLDMGFHDSIVTVLEYAPKQRQTLLFSATYPDEIRALSTQFQHKPVTVTVASLHAETQIEQAFFEVEKKHKTQAVIALLQHYQPDSAALFCNTKQDCANLAGQLRAAGFHASALHGDLEQRERDQVLLQFANRSYPLLVATDVAARGLDIKDLAAVINVDIAFEPEVHIHRIGRTGRAGQNGLALTLCAPGETHRANAIEDYLQQKTGNRETLPWREVPAARAGNIQPPAMATLNIAGGKKEKLRPGDILGALTGDAGFTAAQIGKIDIFDTQAYVAVDYKIANEAVKKLQAGKIKGRNFRVRLLD